MDVSKRVSDCVSVRGITLHYYRIGTGGIPIVFLHGITDDGLCWIPVIEALPEKYDAVLVDLRGHGKSDAPESGYTLENLALDAEALIHALELHKPILIGHSLGAIVSLILAGIRPEVPRAILLEDPPPFWKPGYPSGEDERQRLTMRDWMIGVKRKTKEELLADIRTADPHWSEAEWEAWADSKQRFSLNILEMIRPGTLISVDYPNTARSISCPAEILSADKKHGAASSPEDIALLMEWIPHLTNISIGDAGHSIHRDQFGKYMTALQTALDKFTQEK
jgi:N-formylmaleamate deformylase